MPLPRVPVPRVPVPRVPGPAGGTGAAEAALRERGEELIASILERRKRIAEEFFEMGLELRELAEPAIFRALGYGAFKELLVRRRIVAPVTALKLMTVVKEYPREIALELGHEKGYALARYSEATPAIDRPVELVRRNAVLPGGVTVREAGVREIVRATRSVLGRGRADRSGPEATEARRVARELQRRIRAKGASRATARARGEEGRWEVRVELSVQEAGVLSSTLGR